MNTKCLILASLLAFLAVSNVQAADTVVLSKPNTPALPKASISPVISAPAFSWSGFYLGTQIGNFSSKSDLNYAKDARTGKWDWVDRELSPKPSGFIAGLYAGSNIELGNSFIFGIDMDMAWSDKKDTKTGNEQKITEDLTSINVAFKEAGIPINRPGADDETIPNYGDIVISSVTLKEKWVGATRARIGFSCDRFMPYVSGGVAYTQVQYTMSLLSKSQEDPSFIFASGDVLDKTEKMVGYTLGGGVDIAITDQVILRTEYRYSDFGKKEFAKDKLDIHYKTNDFRIGVGYKF
ncbi:outer membrane immunogenic protein [Bartonella silvatica]|uniref:Outer membrane immunogenic protein n=1 Tax=Bartonella silvatica TaxID=357760 RepID=A0ABV2HH32_9HYPH